MIRENAHVGIGRAVGFWALGVLACSVTLLGLPGCARSGLPGRTCGHRAPSPAEVSTLTVPPRSGFSIVGRAQGATLVSATLQRPADGQLPEPGARNPLLELLTSDPRLQGIATEATQDVTVQRLVAPADLSPAAWCDLANAVTPIAPDAVVIVEPRSPREPYVVVVAAHAQPGRGLRLRHVLTART